MRRNGSKRETNQIELFSDEGKKRLINIADFFCELAELFPSNTDKHGTYDTNCDSMLSVYEKQKTIIQNNFSIQVKRMADVVRTISRESGQMISYGERRVRLIEKACKELGIEVKNIYRFENQDDHLEIVLWARCHERECITLDEFGDYLSVVLNVRLRSGFQNPIFLNNEFRRYHFHEEPVFHFMEGTAMAIRENSQISGDSFRMIETKKGHVLALLSDGTGSGIHACEDSERIIDIYEKMIDADLANEKIIELINGAVCILNQDDKLPTLDICDINLYSGEMELIKFGASCTYRKRGPFIDRIFASSCPLGVQSAWDNEVMKRELDHGDYVIMLSDGALDAVSSGIGEELLPDYLGSISSADPSEMANQILHFCIHQSQGKIKDDMTVVVIGVWKDEAADPAESKTVYR